MAAAGAAVVECGQPGGHQREPRQQSEQHHGEDGHDGAEPGQVVLDGGDGLPHHGDRGGRHGPDESAAAERREVAEQQQYEDERARDGREPCGSRPGVGVRGGPGGEDAEAAGGEQQGGSEAAVALADPGDERADHQEEECDGDERAREGVERELTAGEQCSDHGECHGRHARAGPAGGGTPAPRLEVEVVGHQIGDVVHDGGGRRGVGPDQPEYGAVRDLGGGQRAVVRQCGAVRCDQLPCHRARCGPVVQQLQYVREQLTDRCVGRQDDVGPASLAYQGHPAQLSPGSHCCAHHFTGTYRRDVEDGGRLDAPRVLFTEVVIGRPVLRRTGAGFPGLVRLAAGAGCSYCCSWRCCFSCSAFCFASVCWRKDHPTHPAHRTAAMAIPANTFPSRSSAVRRDRCTPNSSASRILRRRTATDSRSWLS